MAPFLLWIRGKFGSIDATAITVVKRTVTSESEYSPYRVGFRYSRTFLGVKSATVLFDAVSVVLFTGLFRTYRVALFCFDRKAFFYCLRKGGCKR